MPNLSRPNREVDYNSFPSICPIVIDNGAYDFRIGWAGESDPRLSFRNVIHRPRHKTTGETVTIVGNHDPAMIKYFDCTRSQHRSAFDYNVVFQFETMEYILDYGLERLGASGAQVDHPILITECACNPVQSRSKMAELLFETYGVPSVAFGVDAAFSYKYNEQLGNCNKDGLAICSGLNTSHVIPFVGGEPLYEACSRTNIGGSHVSEYLKQLLSLNYPYHTSSLTWDKVEDLKMEHCYVALDYGSEARLFQSGAKEVEEKTNFWQLPWVRPPAEAGPSEEEIARKAAVREKSAQRLKDMAAAKKSSKITDLENELQGLQYLLKQLGSVQDYNIQSFLSQTGYVSKHEIDSAIVKVTQSLRRAKGESPEMKEKTEPQYPLLNTPDSILSPDQIKEKQRQAFAKQMADGRARAKQKLNDEVLQKEKQNQQDEEKRLENPELYLEQLRAKHRELSERVDQRKRLKTSDIHNLSGGVGRGERSSAAKKEKMRLLTTAAFDNRKGDDNFGARDEDWAVYSAMGGDNDDDNPDFDEAELTRVISRLQDIDPAFVANAGPFLSIAEIPKFRPLTQEDFKIAIGVERFRCPEILFQPNMVGVDQAGLDEMCGISIRRLPTKDPSLEDRITSSILMTGGSMMFPGMAERLEVGIRKLRPFGAPIRVVRASDPILDAWRGAAAYAAAAQFSVQTFSKQDYYEKGEDWLRGYNLRYTL